MGLYQKDSNPTKEQKTVTNGSSTQRENITPKGGLQLAPKHKCVLVH